VSDSFTMTAADGTPIAVYRWLPPDDTIVGVVQIAHGAAEHARRYDRVARLLTEAGYAVYADDHRGHGRTAGSLERAGLGGVDSWNGMVRDAKELTDLIGARHPGRPIVLFGHSMGSFITQDYLPRWGGGLAGAVLCGTTGPPPLAVVGLREQVQQAVNRHGRDVPSEEFRARFLGYNEPFAVGVADPTGYEWLSRDPAEVRLYADDPWCGFTLSNGFVLDMFTARSRIWEAGQVERIPTSLPLLVIAGDADPVGRAGEGVRELTQRYRRAGLEVTEILYPGARHEVLNETNRDEVHRDLLAWLGNVLGARAG
jgi:alpha-beta hydrolase superfamily lysophospholipase